MKCECTSHGGFLTRAGLARVAQRTSLEGLVPRGDHGYVDTEGSVSALIEIENDYDYDPTHAELNTRAQLLQLEMF